MAGNTFYQQISANRRNSFLMALFVVVLLGLLGFAIGYVIFGSAAGGLFTTVVAVAVGALSGIGTYFAGDKLVLAVSGAHDRSTEETAPQLLNVVRELAIAANIPVPTVYLIDDTAPNAFATGRDPAHASIAITTGLLEKLDREELQGVIGHELSHVRNLDIRFSLRRRRHGRGDRDPRRLLPALHLLGRRRRPVADRDSGGGGAQAIVFVIAIVLAILAPIISRFIQLAVSRQREYLADASSVELTRNPYGLERALPRSAATRRSSRSPTAAPSTCTSRTRSRSSRRARRA